MTILATFEDRIVLAVDHRGNLVVSDRDFPEFALDLIQDEQLLLAQIEYANLGPEVGEALFSLI